MAGQTTFEAVSGSIKFPDEEVKTMEWWQEIKAFEQCLEQSKGKKPYNFYDGPPFATGLPHYGHILAGTIKDVVCRYAHQRGHHVERRFGWDCHGLPIEYEIDKVFHIKGKPDVLKMGIPKYNEECRKIVQRFTGEWRQIVTRFGRWIDFDNDYKTMDLKFMESCWWVFKQLFDKGQVYRAFRVMPFSTACGTALSNFEVSQNYKEVSDPSVIVQLKVADKENTWLLAWTTTPWTLPSNLALCVNPELTYLRVKKTEDGNIWIVGKDRFAWVCQSIKKDQKKDFEVLEELKGKDLVGTPYIPLFDYFKSQVINDKVWHVVSDGYVSTEAGTCIVHQAPAFGEDDLRVCQKAGIVEKGGKGLFCPVDDAGCFTNEVPDFQGLHVKAADKDIKEMLKKKGHLVFNGNEVHQYPHCWRSDTPLIYKAVPSWFIKVEEARERLIANNNKTHWVPKFVQEKRFHNWLSEARDWCVSRTRYWGTPIPLWVSDDLQEVLCIGSLEELEQHAGRKFTDIHRHFIDDVQIPSKQGKGMLKRVDEVFDCWFESGSMPYASKHYPFENKEQFEKAFPAQFIAEGLDQTRGWFYTLMVLSTHLFNEPPFQNLIVNGLVLAADGKKMSKRLKNYPDPQEIVKSHGADAVRMYMCNSPVVRAEPLKFKEEGVRDVVKDVLLPWYNAYRFLIQESFRYESTGEKFRPNPEKVKASDNFMDKWMIASCHGLIQFTREEMEAYRLYTVVPRLVTMLEDLTNWYIRLNRERMRGVNGPEEALLSLGTLYEVLLNTTVLLAPVTPFITELIYRNLSRALPDGHPMKAESVHFVMIPDADTNAIDPEITQAVARMQSVVELGRTCREWKKVGLKVPLRSMTIMNSDESFIKDIKKLEKYVKEELNVMEVVYRTDSNNMTLVPTLNFKVLGKKLGKDMKAVQKALEAVSQEELRQYEATGKMAICGHTLEAANDEMTLARRVEGNDNPNLQTTANSESTVIMDFTEEEGLKYLGIARVIANLTQKLRKDANLNQDDPVDMWAGVIPSPTGSGTLQKVLDSTGEEIAKFLRRPLWNVNLMQGHEILVKKEDLELENVGGDKLAVSITVRSAYFLPALKELAGGDASVEQALKQYIQTYDLAALMKLCDQGGLKASIGDKSYELKYRKHFVLGVAEANELSTNGGQVAPKPKAAPTNDTAPKKEAAPKKKGKDPTKEKEQEKEELKVVDRKAILKKVLKEGGKRGVEIEGAADMGGLQFFCTSVDEPQGDVEFLMESMKAMNAESDPTEEERKGGSGRIGKMIFSAGAEQLAVLAYTPEAKLDQISCEDWLKTVLATQGGEVLSVSKTLCMGRVKTDSDKNVFPLKIREPMILEANNFLRKKGLFPEDDDDDDEMVFGDDDFPS